jgi:hypothetical protein
MSFYEGPSFDTGPDRQKTAKELRSAHPSTLTEAEQQLRLALRKAKRASRPLHA